MFRFFICINLILVHVFCQTTEDTLQFSMDVSIPDSTPQYDTTAEHTWPFDADYDTTQSWNQQTSIQSFEFTMNSEVTSSLEVNITNDTSQSWEQLTTEQPLVLYNETDATQVWEIFSTDETSDQYNYTATQQLSTTVPITSNDTCSPCVSLDMLEEIRNEIIDMLLLNISNEINTRLEMIEARLTALDKSNNIPSTPIKLSWQIYENLEIPVVGWLHVFDQPYSHKTRIDDLNQIAGICHDEVLVGATYNGSIIVAAVGPATVLTLNTPWNQAQQFGQVYWYRTNGKSFGFSPNAFIRQTYADNEDLESPLRLSWLLDQNIGGYRAGATRSLADNSLWHKVIYCN